MVSSHPDVTAPWKPLSPQAVKRVFEDAPFPWVIAGGWAIDLFLGYQTREHDDIDVLVLRRDQRAVQRHLRGWQLLAADPPGSLRPWTTGETLDRAVHDIWGRTDGSSAWQLQLMLDQAEGADFVSRRHPCVRLPLAQACTSAPSGIPYLAPEVQLFYKAPSPRAKDEQDFSTVVPLLDQERKTWLARAISMTCPDHAWLQSLAS